VLESRHVPSMSRSAGVASPTHLSSHDQSRMIVEGISYDCMDRRVSVLFQPSLSMTNPFGHAYGIGATLPEAMIPLCLLADPSAPPAALEPKTA
jgi:hypothetical protein